MVCNRKSYVIVNQIVCKLVCKSKQGMRFSNNIDFSFSRNIRTFMLLFLLWNNNGRHFIVRIFHTWLLQRRQDANQVCDRALIKVWTWRLVIRARCRCLLFGDPFTTMCNSWHMTQLFLGFLLGPMLAAFSYNFFGIE